MDRRADETWAIEPFHVLIDLVSLPRGIRKRDLKDSTGRLGFKCTGRFHCCCRQSPSEGWSFFNHWFKFGRNRYDVSLLDELAKSS